MASAAAVDFRSELAEAVKRLDPQIRGLVDLSKVSLSGETLAFVNTEIADHTRRRDLCRAVLDALDRLESDGYPDMPLAEVPSSSFSELKGQLADIEAALAEFTEKLKASNISVGLGDPVEKPQSP